MHAHYTRQLQESSAVADNHEENSNEKCNLNTWYQMLAILYMLLIYCQIVIFLIFGCTAFAYMKRFFIVLDDQPAAEQRRLPRREGGRCHPMLHRRCTEYRNSFDYAYFVMARGRVTRTTEVRFL